MTFTIQMKETTKKGPSHEIFPVTEDGKLDRKGRIGGWSSKNGNAQSLENLVLAD
ncbi:MAG: hypothetical protein M3Y27_13705 [Acidobacteriota bacterium]|nr:hypothetical protein [Acidobacteriota bacterium]